MSLVFPSYPQDVSYYETLYAVVTAGGMTYRGKVRRLDIRENQLTMVEFMDGFRISTGLNNILFLDRKPDDEMVRSEDHFEDQASRNFNLY